MKFIYLFAILILATASIFAVPVGAQGRNASPEQSLFQSANRERVAQGLPPLKWSTALAKAAQQHAILMARQNTLSHQLAGELAMQDRASHAGERFSTVAENVAEGTDAENIHRQWMQSAPHRANLLDPQLDSIGIAVAENHGILFAVEDFSFNGGNLSIADQEKMVNTQLQLHGLHLQNYLDEARRSCTLDNGYAGTHEPSFVLHYATSDLQTLPEMLEKRIETGRYHSAAVGACLAGRNTGDASYRVAVLLYE